MTAMEPINLSSPPPSFGRMLARIVSDLVEREPIHVGEWQAMDLSKSTVHGTHELMDAWVDYDVCGRSWQDLVDDIKPDLPWAEDHFQERVSGVPHNPAPSHEWWPYAKGGNKLHINLAGKFDHTYPERYWPKKAHLVPEYDGPGRMGIRFPYGDLNDVVAMLEKNPLTRQAYLPVWFPEDTGNAGKRLPCTLGYHFMIRNNELSCRYYLRSCDVYRHFHNDLFMTARLMQWMVAMLKMGDPAKFQQLETGKLLMVISSLHLFENDRQKMEDKLRAY